MAFLKNKKTSLVVTVFLLLVMAFSVLAVPAAAADDNYPTEPYQSYTYWTGIQQSTPSKLKSLYDFKLTVTGADLGIGNFADPQDVYTDKNGFVFIADSGNSRVVVLDKNFKLSRVIQNLSYNGEALDFTGFMGVYVRDDNNDIYICDTENARIIVLNYNGTVKTLLKMPDADVIPDTFIYRPARVVVDKDGITYVVSDGSYFGAVMYDQNGEFSGFYGANTVKGNLLSALTKLFETLFRNDVKKANQEQSLPYQFNDIAMDEDNFIYTATGATSTWISSTGQLRKLSPGGTNILKDKTKRNVKSSESFNFSDGSSVRYSDKSGMYGYRVTDIRSVDVDEYGYMYTVCRNYGHIFIYDQECRLLGVVGGGTQDGYQKGTFVAPISLRYNSLTKDIIIADKLGNTITVYSETEFGAAFKKAQSLTSTGAYVEAKPYWEKVISMDRGCQLAYDGLSKAAYMEEDYELAMEYAKNAFDQDAYASAFQYVRNDYLSRNFVWIFLVVLVVVGGLIAFLVYSSKHELTLIKNQKIKTMFGCMFHPFESCKKIKYDNQGSIILATIVMLLFYVATVVSDINGGFMFVIFNKSNYNAAYVILTTIGFIILMSIVNWGMATLFEGKGKVKEVYTIVCYSYVPQIIYLILFTLLSNVLTPEEQLVITAIHTIFMALYYIILCVGMMTVHEFGFVKFIGIMIITLIGMLIVVFVAFMVGILVSQLISFIETLVQEVKYR